MFTIHTYYWYWSDSNYYHCMCFSSNRHSLFPTLWLTALSSVPGVPVGHPEAEQGGRRPAGGLGEDARQRAAEDGHTRGQDRPPVVQDEEGGGHGRQAALERAAGWWESRHGDSAHHRARGGESGDRRRSRRRSRSRGCAEPTRLEYLVLVGCWFNEKA